MLKASQGKSGGECIVGVGDENQQDEKNVFSPKIITCERGMYQMAQIDQLNV